MNQSRKTLGVAKCAWCAGTGKWNLAPGHDISCVVCGGKGQVLIAQPASHCQQCKGSGRRNFTSPCLTCAGTGWESVSSQQSYKFCPP